MLTFDNRWWQYSRSMDEMMLSGEILPDAATAQAGKLFCYPNPSKGNITVQPNFKSSGIVQFIVRDITGKILFNKTDKAETGLNTYHLNLNNLTAGTYYLQLRNNSEQKMTKVVISK